MIPIEYARAKNFGHINFIAIVDEVDSFDRLILPIGDSFIYEIGPDFGARLFVEFQLLFRLHDLWC